MVVKWTKTHLRLDKTEPNVSNTPNAYFSAELFVFPYDADAAAKIVLCLDSVFGTFGIILEQFSLI